MSAVTGPVGALWQWDPEEPLGWPLPSDPEDDWFNAGDGLCPRSAEQEGAPHGRSD